jgi:diaminopimelate epimerase
MKIKFTKMHGAGNDFVVIDGINQHIALTPEQWRFIGDRRLAIGADQILLVEKAQTPDTDFRYRIFNADGCEVEQCGNGSRAFVKFVTDKGLTNKQAIKVQVMHGVIEPKLEADGQVTVDMGAPILQPADVPFDAKGLTGKAEGGDALWPLDVNGKTIWISAVSMGNPHAVQIVADVQNDPEELRVRLLRALRRGAPLVPAIAYCAAVYYRQTHGAYQNFEYGSYEGNDLFALQKIRYFTDYAAGMRADHLDSKVVAAEIALLLGGAVFRDRKDERHPSLSWLFVERSVEQRTKKWGPLTGGLVPPTSRTLQRDFHGSKRRR